MTEILRTSTPRTRSSRHRYEALASTTLPERISLTMRMMPAVFAIGDSHGSTEFRGRSRGTMLEWAPVVGRDDPGNTARKEIVMSSDATTITLKGWALILGASSGFGAATSVALARAGCHIFGVHLDRKATLPNAQRIAAEIQELGRESHFFNINAADEDKRAQVAEQISRILEERNELGQLRIMLHSLAF